METGYDILFFWVARMIMSGLEFTGEAPFHTVYLHGLIRDEHGQKMSKTKGNVIDPLIVMDEFGTDALRFTLLVGSTPGKDMNLSVKKVEANRNFANKIWNAGRFVISSLQNVPDKPQSDPSWTLADEYIHAAHAQLCEMSTACLKATNLVKPAGKFMNSSGVNLRIGILKSPKSRLRKVATVLFIPPGHWCGYWINACGCFIRLHLL